MRTAVQSSSYIFDWKKAASLSHIGAVVDESHIGHCGFLAVMRGLKQMKKIHEKMNVFQFRKDLYDFANENSSLFTSSDSFYIQGTRERPWKYKVDEYFEEMKRIWDKTNKAFTEGLGKGKPQRGVKEQYYFRFEFALLVISAKYKVNVFRYYESQERQTRNKNTGICHDIGTNVFFYREDVPSVDLKVRS
jgi:hypothetical protein